MRYDDGLVSCDEDALTIRRYYVWGGSKRIPYQKIRSITTWEMTTSGGRARVWGSGDFRHWWNLDMARPAKSVAFALDVGKHWMPTISPDDSVEVGQILAERTGLTLAQG